MFCGNGMEVKRASRANALSTYGLTPSYVPTAIRESSASCGVHCHNSTGLTTLRWEAGPANEGVKRTV